VKRHLTLILTLAAIASALALTLLMWLARGYLVSESSAHGILYREGFHGGHVKKTQVWFTVTGGCQGEAAKFEGTAVTQSGERVPVMVCVDWPWYDGWASVQHR